MGATQAKLPAGSPWDSAEAECLIDAFSRAAGEQKQLDAEHLARFCELTPWLADRLFLSLKKVSATEKARGLKLPEFSTALAKCCSSSRFERREFVLDVMGAGRGSLSKKDLLCFFENAFAFMLPSDVAKDTALVTRLASQAVDDAFENIQGDSLNMDQGDNWLSKDPSLESIFCDLLTARFLRTNSGPATSTRRMPKLSKPSQLLRDEHLWALSGHLPAPCTKSPWKLLFSSTQHGKAFSRFVSKLIFKGPTVLVVRDSKGAVFGAFAPVSWHRTNRFYGEAAAFLFSVAPRCRVYRSSGVNSNYMFLATSLSTVTNGLGMGGQMDYWGLYLDSLLEKGACRAPCSTFGTAMPCLSSESVFEVETLEAWACQPDYVADERELEAAGVKRRARRTWDACQQGRGGGGGGGGGARTALDANPETQAILDAAGRGGHSQDIRIADAAAEREAEALRWRAAGGAEAAAAEDEDEEEFEEA